MRAYAKINLRLDILDKREDGFHNINSVMQQIDLYDELEFKECEDIIVQSQFKDEIILKTVLRLKELFDVKEGIKILTKKNIPVGAGLASGSADAALTLVVLNKWWDLNLSLNDLIKMGAELGSDIPFCLTGGCCFVSGMGDIIEKLEGVEMDLVLVNPGYGISTKQAYNELDKKEHGKNKSTLKLKNAKNTKELAAALHNDFINIQKEDVKNIIKELIDHGALNASITGKGPTVFGIFEDEKKAKDVYGKLKDKYNWVYQTKTINSKCK